MASVFVNWLFVGVIFGLYAKEDILSQQGEVLVEKDTLLEKKATDEKGQLTFDSDLYHGKYYVKEEVRKPGYLPNEEIWEIDASYIDQNLAEIKLSKRIIYVDSVITTQYNFPLKPGMKVQKIGRAHV